MQGARLGQFELLDKVGEGGMGIITIYDIAEESGCTAFVMGYVNGQPLEPSSRPRACGSPKGWALRCKQPMPRLLRTPPTSSIASGYG